VGAGAFGAHALAGRLDGVALERWATAARYLMYGGLGLLALGAAGRGLLAARSGQLAAGLLLAGSWVFALALWSSALGGPRSLGLVPPMGGLAMIAGFVLAAWAARTPRR
jgi:uncharacterized membrane protein YgdD (TMEM256/DUF423 family)